MDIEDLSFPIPNRQMFVAIFLGSVGVSLTVACRLGIKLAYIRTFVDDLGEHDRQFLTSAVRTFKPADRRIQYPKQCLEHMPAAILERLGVQAVRYGVSFQTTEDEPRYPLQLGDANTIVLPIAAPVRVMPAFGSSLAS